MQKNLILVSISAFVLICSAGICIAQGTDKITTLRFGGSDPIDGLEDRSNKLFIDKVHKYSAGKAKIEYFPADQLGNEREQIEGLRAGTQHFFSDPLEWHATMVKDFAVLTWGFTFRNMKHQDTYFQGLMFADMAERLRKGFGLKILAVGHRTPRTLFTRKPVNSLEDIQGMKMRCPPIEQFVEFWKALGTKPTQISWSEAYLALKTGVADGIEASVAVIYHARHFEPCPYLINTNHVAGTQHILMRDETYQKLPPDLQKIIDRAAKESMEWYADMQDKMEQDYIQKMLNEGLKSVIKVNMDPWRKRSADKVPEMENKGLWPKGLYEKIQQVKE